MPSLVYKDSGLVCPSCARRSRLAQQRVAHCGTIAPVIGGAAIKLRMLCAHVPLRILLWPQEPETATH